MKNDEKWLTIKIPRDLKKNFEEIDNSFTNFAQFAQYALRKELERLNSVK